MASCKECLHYDICSSIEGLVLRVILAGDKADERCGLFKPTADVVEVVRCKECRYSMKSWITPSYDERQYLCNRTDDYHKPTDFCSYGERKEEE